MNISLDTLRRDRFRQLTRVDGLERVLRGIEAARQVGFHPIKLNVVALKENLDEVLDILEFGVEKGLEVRFIELMPVLGGSGLEFISSSRVKEIIRDRYALVPVRRKGHPRGADPHGAAEVYRLDGTGATCGFISSMSHPFCHTCNRIRLRGDGLLKPCLASRTSFSLMRFVRPVFQRDALEEYLSEVIPRCKKRSRGEYEIDTMSAFGG